MKAYDLSHAITPEKEEYILQLTTFSVSTMFKQYKTLKDDWYIMQELTLNTHVGTHIESPFHHCKHGKKILDLNITHLVNRLICLDVSDKLPGECIEKELLIDRAQNMNLKERVVFLHTGRDLYYHDVENAHCRPYLAPDAVEWLVSSGIVCLGVDSTGIEVQHAVGQPNHKKLFASDIPLVENLVGLDRLLDGDEYYVLLLPLPIVGLESSPLRVVAVNKKYLIGLIDGM